MGGEMEAARTQPLVDYVEKDLLHHALKLTFPQRLVIAEEPLHRDGKLATGEPQVCGISSARNRFRPLEE